MSELTIFTVPKAFKGHVGMIQRNAIQSWLRIRNRPEIILIGDEEGMAEIAREFKIFHIPEVATSKRGVPLVNDVFRVGEENAPTDIVAYVNTDILLSNNFVAVAMQMANIYHQFLMIGQRWDVDINQPIDFTREDWGSSLPIEGMPLLHQPWGVDYFVYRKGLWPEIPPFILGRLAWDNWLVRMARDEHGVPVIDATQVITALHQNHGRGHYLGGIENPEVRYNHELMGNVRIAGIQHATHKLMP